MRHYVPLRADADREKKLAPTFVLPFWVWIVLLAGCMLVVLALR